GHYSAAAAPVQSPCCTSIDTFLHSLTSADSTRAACRECASVPTATAMTSRTTRAAPGRGLALWRGCCVSAGKVLFGQALLDQVTVTRRGHALELLEAPVEVGQIVEARFEADVGHRLFVVQQQFAGFADTQAVDEFHVATPGGTLEEAREIGGFHAQVRGHFLQRQLAHVVLEDVVDGHVGAVTMVVVAQLRGGRAG